MEDIVRELVSELKKDKPKISYGNIPKLVIQAMTAVENYKALSGEEKKDLVVKTITLLIDESDLMDGFLPIIPALIENFLEVNNGEVVIKKKNRDKDNKDKKSCFCL